MRLFETLTQDEIARLSRKMGRAIDEVTEHEAFGASDEYQGVYEDIWWAQVHLWYEAARKYNKRMEQLNERESHRHA